MLSMNIHFVQRHENKVQQDNRVSVVANDMHISNKEVITYTQKHNYRVFILASQV